jgi:uncharacterized small protein (DUF1192 family)
MMIAALLVATSAHAQVYKCRINGQMVFSDQPCAADAKPIDVRPASGRGADSTPAPGAAPINASNNPQALIARMERDRRIRDLEYDIRARRARIGEEQAAMEREVAALRGQKSRANNNLAGATWEKSISEEMSATVARYDVRIRALQDEIDRMEVERERMVGAGR